MDLPGAPADEAREEGFEMRFRALEGERAEIGREERWVSTLSAGAGGVVAVIVRVLGGGESKDDRRNVTKR